MTEMRDRGIAAFIGPGKFNHSNHFFAEKKQKRKQKSSTINLTIE